MEKAIRTFESFVVSKKDQTKKSMELQWAQYNPAIYEMLSDFWNSKIPDLDEDSGVLLYLAAIKLRSNGVVIPWKACYRWFRTLSDVQVNFILESLYMVSENSYFSGTASDLCVLNEVNLFLLWLPSDMKVRICDMTVLSIKNFWNRFRFRNGITKEDIERLGYYCTLHRLNKDVAHPLMLDPLQLGDVMEECCRNSEEYRRVTQEPDEKALEFLKAWETGARKAEDEFQIKPDANE